MQRKRRQPQRNNKQQGTSLNHALALLRICSGDGSDDGAGQILVHKRLQLVGDLVVIR